MVTNDREERERTTMLGLELFGISYFVGLVDANIGVVTACDDIFEIQCLQTMVST